MLNTKVHNLVYILLTFPVNSFANTEHVPYDIQIPPKFDPRLTEYVWFSSYTTKNRFDNHDSSSSFNIVAFILHGAIDNIMDFSKKWNKEKNKVPKVEKIVIRL